MRGIKYIVMLFAIFLMALPADAQHDALYSQYMFNQIAINPAYAGRNDVMELNLLYRRQWESLEGAPEIITFSAHSPLRNQKINLGVNLSNSSYGVNRQTRLTSTYTYRIKWDKANLAFGLNAGAEMFSVNWAAIETIEGNDQAFLASDKPVIVPQAGFGIYFHTERFFTGASVPTLMAANTEELNINSFKYKPYFFMAGVLVDLGEHFKWKPTTLVKYMRHSPVQVDLNSTFYYKDIFGVGASYRRNNALVFLADINIRPQLKIGYAYDAGLSTLKRYNANSHEFMIQYVFGYEVEAKSPRYF